MTFHVFYSDGRQPRHETTIEAPDHRTAAQAFVSQHPVSSDRRMNVEAIGGDYSIQQFKANEFTGASAQPGAAAYVPSVSAAVKTYPAVRTLASVYRGLAYVILCIGILLCIVVAVQTNNFLAVLALGLYVAFLFLILLAGGELLGIMPDLADRAHLTNELLRDIKELLSKET